MKTVTIQEAETQLSKLVASAADGEVVVIEDAGKPLVKLVAIEPAAKPVDEKPLPRRLGFMRGEMKIPDDFDRLMEDEIAEMFYGDDSDD
jgi:prevent-host-death family protein